MNRLIVFTRYPEAGKAKTRLIPALGAEGAAELHRRMVEHVVDRLRALVDRRAVSIEVRYEGGCERLVREWLGPDLLYRPQGSGDLGDRMDRALREAMDDGAGRVVLVGSDCPDITAGIVEKAFEALGHSETVFGPAEDGGYYLVGLKRKTPELFAGISWGTAHVLKHSLHIANEGSLSVHLLERLRDVDRPEDLEVWNRIAAAERISIIIPTLNEAENLLAALESAQLGRNVDIMVVDGGSVDGTVDLARSRGVRVVAAPRGRGGQLNLGASRATGGILLFLHADCTLPGGFDRHIRRALAGPDAVGGAFELRIALDHLGVRIIEWLGNWRSRQWCLPYGDQGIFVKAEVFREIGGFPEMDIMEDFAFVRSLCKRGRVVVLPQRVTASNRRWRAIGILRTTLINQAIIVGYRLGVSPATMERWYNREKGRKSKA